MSLLFGIKQVAAFALLAMGTALAADAPRQVIVMIDAGHGGSDSGALGPNEAPKKKGAKPLKRLMEKNLTLQLAKLLGNQLKSQNCVVCYTRATDVAVPLANRAKAANDVGADIFVSIHLNAFRNKNARGSEVFFLSLGPVDAELQALAEAENETGTSSQDTDLEETDIVARILEDLAQRAYLRESERMAVFIQTELNRLAGIKERGVKQAPFTVLRMAAMPAVLVEIVFISNPTESAKLRDPAFLKSAANAIAKGIQKYIESTGNSSTRRKATT
ncbi:MAG: N-acetylmuramoyl-L-alanine amidase [Holophagales bacterium]|jgi:N-acetylmuramoyl-L-alanine amidase|nr:N-acetylmuramoyl-L-alanine amidase [Holophagales bacterium]